jgi:hypothetical protein
LAKLKALLKGLENIVFPEAGKNGEIKALLDEAKYPWKLSDSIALLIIGLAVAALIAFWPQ